MSARETVEQWLSRFNAGDAEGIAAPYAQDAVNDQIPLQPVVGRTAIAEFHRETFLR